MKYNFQYQPHSSEEEEAYFHGEVYSLLRIKSALNELHLRYDTNSPDELLGFERAVFKMNEAIKMALEDFDNGYKEKNE